VEYVKNGVLAKYTASALGVYKCPADIYLSPAQKRAGWTSRLRSNSMSAFFGRSEPEARRAQDPTAQGVNWGMAQYKQFLKLSDVPSPAQTYVTVDEHPDSINDGFFIIGDTATQWGDLPASYHNGACGFSFSDGHAEVHKWQSSTSKYPVKYAFGVRPFDAAGRRDFQWYKDRVQYIRVR
jgi:prepilin-type processing-associated H-X9-DG protein